MIAGGGAVVVSSNSGGPERSYEAAASQPSQEPGASYARGGGVLPVSRSIDRETIERQTALQAKQRLAALRELTAESQKRAHELKANQWVLPVAGYSITAVWGQTSYLWTDYHTGIDFSAAEGTEIVSVAHGVVTYAGYDDAYGNLVKVELDDGLTIWYAHQSDYAVEVGQEVNPGDLIGYVGSTGNTTGPHLHLEVRQPDGTEDGQDIDPYDVFIEHGVTP